MNYHHRPVLLKEAIECLNPKANENFIDCTLGLAGHSAAILEKTAPSGKLLAIEQNAEGLHEAKKKLSKYQNRITFVCDNFRNLKEIVRCTNFPGVSGILLDLGLASWQIESSNLGISFQKDEPLDMRLGRISDFRFKISDLTAEEIINKYSLKKLAEMFYQYGEVRNSWQIARRIDQARRVSAIKTTFDLVKALKTKNPKILAPVFQALRIEVNRELENLAKVLPQAIEVLEKGGRLAVISYHSGEDRIVKFFFRDNKNQLNILTKKPITPTSEEVRINLRSRSAKMRVGVTTL